MPRKNNITQASTSKSFTQMEVDSDEEDSNIDLLVTNFVKFILNNSLSKFPTKRSDINKSLGINSKLSQQVAKKASEALADIYGVDLVEVTEKSGKSFIIIPSQKLPSGSILTDDQSFELKILFIILSYIFMKSGEVQEVNLLNFLDKLNINLDEFAKSKDRFIKQLYLKRKKVDVEGQNEPLIYYSWGERSSLEFSKKNVLECVAQLVKKPSKNYSMQYKEVYGEQVNETQMIQ